MLHLSITDPGSRSECRSANNQTSILSSNTYFVDSIYLALTMHPDKLKNPTEEDKNRYMNVENQLFIM